MIFVMSRTRFRVNPIRLRTKSFWVRVQLQSLHLSKLMENKNQKRVCFEALINDFGKI